jgi:hypothetical protein
MTAIVSAMGMIAGAGAGSVMAGSWKSVGGMDMERRGYGRALVLLDAAAVFAIFFPWFARTSDAGSVCPYPRIPASPLARGCITGPGPPSAGRDSLFPQ